MMESVPQQPDRRSAEGFRITPQRRTVLETLKSHPGQHLTAEEIHETANATGSKLSMATVYRALSGLEKLGLVSKLAVGKRPATYELIPKHSQPHCHLICLGCGRVFEVRGVLPEGLVEVVAETQNFQVARGSVEIFGYCESCEQRRCGQRQETPRLRGV
ncbi:MAG: transcriptional repressor [Firmicutes bacterium]|jgi:Fur family ferric uptake transcriptional regulator|nr:transcriptional repressor [Bacillota bacterium]MDH7496775.1 transcriptional repressor [Bacillota bacterium]